MRRTNRNLPALLCFLILGAALMPAGVWADSESEFLNRRALEKNLRDLRDDRAETKIHAIYFLSSSKQPRFLRPLGAELLRSLDKDSPTLFAAPFDPYIKSLLARGIGRMGRPEGLYYLAAALTQTDEIMTELKKKSAARWERDRKFAEEMNASGSKTDTKNEKEERSINDRAIPRLTLESDRPGPALMRQGHSMPFSPDVHWSVSDEFKATTVDLDDDSHRMRMHGYNYTNVAVSLLDGFADLFEEIGEKMRGDYGPTHVEQLKKFLTHEYSSVRSAAARALGQLGGLTALSALDQHLKTEKNKVVRTQVCRGVLAADRTRTDCYKQLLDTLRSPDRDERLSAAVALRELAFGESLPLLRGALDLEEVPELRQVLREAIVRATVDSMQGPSGL